MTQSLLFGCDISHHQNSASLPWDKFAASSSFIICRGSYGTMRDRAVAEHVRRARAVGLAVGLYHFYRPSQPIADQLATFHAAAEAAKYQAGDIIPALDVEMDPLPAPGTLVSTKWQDGVLGMLDALSADYGDAMIYITQREFGMLGRPAWLLNHPLWVAHYTTAAHPATPGDRPWTIWQFRVGPYDPNGKGGYDKVHPVLDQNRAVGPLPLVGSVPGAIIHDTERPAAELSHEDHGFEALALARAAQNAVDVAREDFFGDEDVTPVLPREEDDETGKLSNS